MSLLTRVIVVGGLVGGLTGIAVMAFGEVDVWWQLLLPSAAVLLVIVILVSPVEARLRQAEEAAADADKSRKLAEAAGRGIGITAAITGRAIYEGTLDFAEGQRLADRLSASTGPTSRRGS